jgi:fatty acid desaturase
LLAEHTGCEMSSDTYANTRTTITNPVVRFFAWNMPYHVEHHAYPAIPFHSLPRAHEHLRGAERTVSPGYLSATRSIFRYLTSHHSPVRASASARTEAKTW